MNLPTNAATMSSRDIAELTGSTHEAVKKSAARLSAVNLITSPLADTPYTAANKQTYYEFHFNKRDSLVLVARLSPEFTAVVIDRWQELESAEQSTAVALPDFSNPAAAARAWAEQYEISTAAQEQLQIAAPKVAFVDELVNRDNLMTATQVGQKHKMSAIKLNRFLDELGGVYSKRVERGRVFLQPFINKGYGELKQNNTGHDQPLFTNKGEIWINEQLAAKGDG